jgi:hypothetical protein
MNEDFLIGRKKFHEAVEKMLGDKIRSDDEVAAAMWSALANVDWYNPELKLSVEYSFRAAGDFIAEIRGIGHYMDWYCCGPYAQVSDYIARSLKKEGWIYDDMPAICDEPGCLEFVSCGFPTKDGGYRCTCHEHYKKLQANG